MTIANGGFALTASTGTLKVHDAGAELRPQAGDQPPSLGAIGFGVDAAGHRGFSGLKQTREACR